MEEEQWAGEGGGGKRRGSGRWEGKGEGFDVYNPTVVAVDIVVRLALSYSRHFSSTPNC